MLPEFGSRLFRWTSGTAYHGVSPHAKRPLMGSTYFLVLVGVLAMPGQSLAQFTIGPDGPQLPKPSPHEARAPDGPRVFQITIEPMPEGLPALKYRLNVSPSEQITGNGVPFILRALYQLRELHPEQARRVFYERVAKLEEAPLAEFPVEETRAYLKHYESIFTALELASHQDAVDWGWKLEELNGEQWIGFFIPEIQDCRDLSRLLIMKGKLELAERRFGDAARTIRTGFFLAQAVSESSFLISNLVGVAIAGQMNQLLIAWISISDSPSLYWPLAALDHPLIDISRSTDLELGLSNRFAPWLKDANFDQTSAIGWRDRFVSLLKELVRSDGRAFPIMSLRRGTEVSDDLAALAATVIGLKHYPATKRELISQGYDENEVERMPVGKVLAIHQQYLNQLAADEMIKVTLVPAVAFQQTQDQVKQKLLEMRLFGPPSVATTEPFPLTSLFGSAGAHAIASQHRLSAQFAGLQTMEAIRLHVGATGKLPQSLEDINTVPVPQNPWTNDMFDYVLRGNVATLEVVTRPGHDSVSWRFEIRVAPSATK